MAEPSLQALIEALRRLPGVGVKSASRMAFHLLQHDREGAPVLAHALGMTRARLRSHPEEAVEAAAAHRFLELIERRAAGEPVA